MKSRFLLIAAALGIFLGAEVAQAADVFVRGYHRSDGTYVRPHYRSSPDSLRSNNYGPSRNSNELLSPRSRDYDRDGSPNYLDRDSDNDGFGDNFDLNPYGSRSIFGN